MNGKNIFSEKELQRRKEWYIEYKTQKINMGEKDFDSDCKFYDFVTTNPNCPARFMTKKKIKKLEGIL